MTLAQLIKEMATALTAQGEDTKYYPDYSGRGMYGEPCVGVVGNADAVIAEVIKAVHFDKKKLPVGTCFASVVDILMANRRDQLGLRSITYWPDIIDESEQVEEVDIAHEE